MDWIMHACFHTHAQCFQKELNSTLNMRICLFLGYIKLSLQHWFKLNFTSRSPDLEFAFKSTVLTSWCWQPTCDKPLLHTQAGVCCFRLNSSLFETLNNFFWEKVNFFFTALYGLFMCLFNLTGSKCYVTLPVGLFVFGEWICCSFFSINRILMLLWYNNFVFDICHI